MMKPELLDDEIGRKLADAERSGELRSAPGYGRPLQEDAAWAQTPEALRMPFKILKDAGVVPAEVEMLKRRALLRLAVHHAKTPAQAAEAQARLALLEQSISLRLEALRGRS